MGAFTEVSPRGGQAGTEQVEVELLIEAWRRLGTIECSTQVEVTCCGPKTVPCEHRALPQVHASIFSSTDARVVVGVHTKAAVAVSRLPGGLRVMDQESVVFYKTLASCDP